MGGFGHPTLAVSRTCEARVTDYPNVPKAPPLPTPPVAPVPPPPTLKSSTKDGDFFMEWVEPLEKWKDYDDYGFLTGLETSHLIVYGAEGVTFTPEVVLPPTPSELDVPTLKIASPLGKGVITTNPFNGPIDDGQAVYIKDVEFPIKDNVTKDLTVSNLSQKRERRTDSLFMGVRNGDSVYFRGQTSAPAPPVPVYATRCMRVADGIDDPGNPPGSLVVYTRTDGSVSIRAFSGAAMNALRFAWEVPTNIDASVKIQYRVLGFFSTAVMTAQKVSFHLAGYSIGNNDNLDGTYGTAIKTIISGTYSLGDRFATAWSDPVTVSNLAADELAMLRLHRDPADPDDTYVNNVGVYGLDIKYAVTT